MAQVLLRAGALALVVLIGILLRSFHVVDDNAGDVVKKILINVSLPAAIVVNFSAISTVGAEMLVVTALGILANVIMVLVGMVLTRKKSPQEQVLQMMCLPAYNIGAFCLPFVQSFLPALGSVAACMFDVGNSFMCTGATYAFVAEYTSQERQGIHLKDIFKRLFSSVPLDTYVLMFLLAVCGIAVPDTVLTLLQPMSSANAFVAMMMLGLLFHLELKREYLGRVLKMLAIRHIFAIMFALGFYFLLPFDLVIRQTLVLICFAPMSAVAPAFTGICGGDEGMASCTNSLTIICSLVTITALIAVMGLNG